MVVSSLTVIAVFGILCSLGYYALCLWGARRFLRRAKVSVAGFAPGVSILKPLRGTDPQAYESFRTHCQQEYPEFEIIFGVTDSNDPNVPVIERLMREFPERAIRLVVCPKILGTNRKVSTLLQLLPLAKYEHLLVTDGDIQVPRDYLRRVLAPFEDPRAGMVTCMYRGVSSGTLGSRLEALGISGDFFPGVLAAQEVEGGIHFALGSTLAFRRTALEGIGGLEPLADYLADDFELGFRISNAGFGVQLSDAVVEHHLPAYSFSGFLEHQLRWARSTRNSRPWGYLGLVLTLGLPWALLAVVVTRGALWAWALLGVTLTFRLAVALVVGKKILGDRQVLRDIWLIPVRDLIGLAIWVGSYMSRRVTWRGQQFVLEGGKLRPA